MTPPSSLLYRSTDQPDERLKGLIAWGGWGGEKCSPGETSAAIKHAGVSSMDPAGKQKTEKKDGTSRAWSELRNP